MQEQLRQWLLSRIFTVFPQNSTVIRLCELILAQRTPKVKVNEFGFLENIKKYYDFSVIELLCAAIYVIISVGDKNGKEL